ncbi:radical SAM/SPASM domain-containing protein [Parabacteroides sp. FAFU027]|uniref:radical SAM/SPASM domain-containing protein n=1 Tax=Parabacteroides sp. FAFU027 TaxID=2922715 RepID=UPI001FB01EF6|nr:radical SAM protein [Parabacteroides sp. FAFU027]
MLNLPHIAFETTDRCNLDCVYCYNIWKTDAVERTPFNSYQKAIGTLKQLFSTTNIQYVAFTGGEPFLSERFAEVILYCRMEGKQVTLISNGTKGTEKDYKRLIKLGVGLFEFPIHSAHAEVHDQMVQIKGSWQKSVDSTLAVLKNGGRVVPVVVITKHNVNQLGETLEYIASLGCRRIMLNRYNIGGKGCNQPLEVSATAEELRNAFATANDKAAELDLQLSANVCTPVCLLNPADYPLIAFGHCSFDVLRRPITVDINGNVRLCNHSPVVAGNIFEKEMEEILFSDYTREWEETVPAFCSDCSHWTKCKGGCRAASEQCQQSLAKEDPIIEHLGILALK